MREEVSVSLFRTQNWNWSLTNALLPSPKSHGHRRRQRGSGGSGFEPGGQEGKEFYRPSWNSQERGGSKQLHWLGSWIFFGCTKQLLEQQFLVR